MEKANSYSKKQYIGKDLKDSDFRGADLRGYDFKGAKLSNANFSGCRTGVKTSSSVIIFIAALIISLMSGYIAMLSGTTLREMLASSNKTVVATGYINLGLMIVFMILTVWKGGKVTIISIAIIVPFMLLLGVIARLTDLGTGEGSIQGSFTMLLFLLMIIIGTIARASAGTMSSNIIFIAVAVSGPLFGKFVLDAGYGTTVLAIACAVISKRSFSNSETYPLLKFIALKTGSYLGTSFEKADLTGANFSGATIKNTNFKGAKLSGVNWENAKKEFNFED